MIRYSLRCDREHRFDSWFGSSADFDRLTGAKLLACVVCGSSAVEKDLMAPNVAGAPAEPQLRAPRRGASTKASRPSARSSARPGLPRRGR